MYDKQLELAIRAAVGAGNLLVQSYDDRLNTDRKESLRDIVTDIDRLAERNIIQNLQDDGQNIISEESASTVLLSDEPHWIVDPLDGTVNFVNHIPFFAVSIAYVVQRKPVVGVVFNPLSNDLYYGAEGTGAFKNDAALRVVDKLPEESLFAVAFSGKNYAPSSRNEEFRLMGVVNDNTRGCLRTGSAAMNLAYLSEGRLSGCWAKANKIWDVAAGLLIAQLAGARVEFAQMKSDGNLVSYIAAVPSAWEFIKDIVQKVIQE